MLVEVKCVGRGNLRFRVLLVTCVYAFSDVCGVRFATDRKGVNPLLLRRLVSFSLVRVNER